MVSREDVLACYKYILGRAPENDDVVQSRLSVASIADLRQQFITSSEFQRSLPGNRRAQDALFPPPVWAANRVDADCSPAQLAKLLDRIRREWEEFGKTEPHWSVLTHDKYRPGAIKGNLDEFFASGRLAADIVRSFAVRQRLSLDDMQTCFELGCGVGRVTIHLADLFPQVIGADISRFHLDECAAALADRDIGNVQLICLDTPGRVSEMPEIGFFFSFIVLQHNPPPVIVYILDNALRKLKKGGAAVFQVPTWRNGYEFDLAAYLAVERPLQMEMHVLPQAHVFRVIERNGCQLVEVREDGWASGRTAETVSNTFFVIKP